MSESISSDFEMSPFVTSQAEQQKQFMFSQMHATYHAASMGQNLPRLSLGHSALNTALGGGVLCRRVHLVTSQMLSCANAAFSLALVAMMLRSGKAKGPIIWCGPKRAGVAGDVFGAGLSAFGLSPSQFIFVRESHPLRRMAACEEALITPGLSAVIHEYGPLHEKTALWQKSARRLQLACERGTATAFLIGAAGAASGFESAWDIHPSSYQGYKCGDWRPMWQARLRHARGGYPASADVIWDHHSASFHPVSQVPSTTSQPAWSDATYAKQPFKSALQQPALWQQSA